MPEEDGKEKNVDDIMDDLVDIYSDYEEENPAESGTEEGKEGEEDGKEGQESGKTDDGKEGKEGKRKESDELAERIRRGEEHLQNLNKAIAEANRTLHNIRQEKKAPTTEESPLSNAQLLKLMEDAKGDNETLLQIIRYTAEQAAKGAKKEAVAETDIIKKRDESVAALRGLFKEGYDDPDTIKAVDDVKEYYGITDHPFGDIFARGVLTMKTLPIIVETWKAKLAETEKEIKGKEDAEKARQGKIASQGGGSRVKGSGGGEGGKETFGLTAEQIDVARRLGYTTTEKLKRYAAIVGATNKPKEKAV